jgi:hypothetical protein
MCFFPYFLDFFSLFMVFFSICSCIIYILFNVFYFLVLLSYFYNGYYLGPTGLKGATHGPLNHCFFIVFWKIFLEIFLIRPSKKIKINLYYYVKVYINKKIPKYVIKIYSQIVFLMSKLLVNNSYKSLKVEIMLFLLIRLILNFYDMFIMYFQYI